MAGQPENQRPCLLFLQVAGPETRTFRNYPNVSIAFDALLALYEDSLPPEEKLCIDLERYYKFIDDMPDLFLMLYDPAINAFEPHAKSWIKTKTYSLFRDSERDWSNPPTINGNASNCENSSMDEDKPFYNSQLNFDSNHTPF